MCQTRKPLPNHTDLPAGYDAEDEGCPVHGTPSKKEYIFGMMDSKVWVFAGCKCAVSERCDSLMQSPMYHTNYGDAAGRARMIKAFEATW